jgi:predicted tellurium resistance membrane protein TerC
MHRLWLVLVNRACNCHYGDSRDRVSAFGQRWKIRSLFRIGIQTMEYLVALLFLTAMEIVLGIDNIVFITILSGRLPEHQQPSARRVGLTLAMGMRILLLLTLKWILGLEDPIFHFSDIGVPESWLSEEINDVSVRDLILAGGGLFLIWKSVHEIHLKVAGAEHDREIKKQVSYMGVLAQICVMDLIFSLDSVITAVGMVKADGYGIWVMVTAVMVAVVVMLIFAEAVSHFVEKNPTLKMLAVSFLLLIGVMLVAEGIGTGINKGYIYFAMAFALGVEILNLRVRTISRARRAAVEARPNLQSPE